MFDRSLIEGGNGIAGRVQAVFRRAALVATEGGPLVTLLPPGEPLVPLGAAVPWLPPPRVDEEVRLEGRRLTVGGRAALLEGEGETLALPLPCPADAVVLGRQLPSLPLPARTRALLGDEPAEGGLDGRITALAAAGLARLADAIVDGSEDPPVGRLTGLGPGSTPTGDDLLAAATAAAWRWAAAGWLARGALDGLGRALRGLPRAATTRVAREMLDHAANGRFPAPLRDLVAALGDGRADVEGAARRLAGLGARTGSDMIAGALAVTRALLRTKGGTS